jgi:hypothetical protein
VVLPQCPFRFVELDSNELYGWLICGDISGFFTLASDGDFSKAILERYVSVRTRSAGLRIKIIAGRAVS